MIHLAIAKHITLQNKRSLCPSVFSVQLHISILRLIILYCLFQWQLLYRSEPPLFPCSPQRQSLMRLCGIECRIISVYPVNCPKMVPSCSLPSQTVSADKIQFPLRFLHTPFSGVPVHHYR